MEVVQLTDDDLYSGFDDLKVSPVNQLQRLSAEGASRKGGRFEGLFSRGGPPQTGYLASSSGRKMTTSSSGMPLDAGSNLARPMTAIRGVGYTSYGNRGFDPLNISAKIQSSQLPGLENVEESAEEKIWQVERKINTLVEESCISASQKDVKSALEKAKEAAQKERALARQREQAGLGDQPNLDLTFVVLFNLASQYTANDLYSEALNTYQVLMRNRLFQNAGEHFVWRGRRERGRLKVNMGNVYVKLGHYSKAIKFYRMALDQVPNTHKKIRIKIMQNIGILFVKMGKYNDAIASFEYIMGESPDFKSGLNLVLCYYALGDRDKMRRSFQKLVDIPLEERDVVDGDKQMSNLDGALKDVIESDALWHMEAQRKHDAEWSILMAAKLISPVIDDNLNVGFAWCVDVVRSSAYSELAQELEINKAILFLKQKELPAAMETLKSFERKKDTKVASSAATNLAFLHLLENDLVQANQYADAAIAADHYNPGALVNKGCCFYAQGDFNKAQEYFREALSNEATCVEALYNLGLSLKKAGQLDDALECFSKLQTILPNQPQVVYQLADVCELLGDKEQSMEWHLQLLSLVPSDPALLHRVGTMYDSLGDKQQAFQHNYDSFRYFPSDAQVSTWLGAYFIESEVYEKAATYFERAAAMQPSEVKWQLMVASCHRRSGNYQKALAVYKAVHRKFPENVECLKFIVRLCSDMGLQEASHYATLLSKAEQAQANREQQGSGGLSSRSRRQQSGVRSQPIDPVLDQGAARPPTSSKVVVDASYDDPLQPSRSELRPRTSARNHNVPDEAFTDDDELSELLP